MRCLVDPRPIDVEKNEKKAEGRTKKGGKRNPATHPKSAMAMSRTLYSRPLTVSTVHIAEGAAILNGCI